MVQKYSWFGALVTPGRITRRLAAAGFAIGAVACNAALGIDDATLSCEGTACGQQDEETSSAPLDSAGSAPVAPGRTGVGRR